MPGNSPGLRYLNDLRLGYEELAWLQDDYDLHARLHRMASAYEPGWVGGSWLANGATGLGWNIVDGGTGNLAVDSIDGGDEGLALFRRRNNTDAPALGVDPDGQLLMIYPNDGQLLRDAAGALISVPNDGVWRTLVARATLQVEAPGRMDMTVGVATVVGDGTQFLRYSDGGDLRATKFRVPSGANAGDYEFLAIASDTSTTITPLPVATEANVEFVVIGDFASAAADRDIHSELVVTWELVTRTVAPQTDALIAYDCMRTGGTLSLIDRRRANIYRPAVINHERRWHIQPELVLGPSAAAVADYPAVPQSAARALYYSPCTSTPAGGSHFCAVAPAAVGSGLHQGADVASGLLGAFVKDNVTWQIEIREYVPQAYVHGTSSSNAEAPWRNPDGGAAVTPISSQTGDCRGLALLAVPNGTGNTHLMWYLDTAGDLYQLSSSDNGATWTVAAVITLGFAAGYGIGATLTRTGRILLVLCNDSGTEIRYIRSDNYGTTWDTNTTAGHAIDLTGGVGQYRYPSIAEDDFGNLWLAIEDWSSGASGRVVVLYRGTDVNDPAPSSDTPAGGWIVSPDPVLNATTPPTDFTSPQVLPGPDGQVFVFMLGLRDAAFAELGVATTTHGELTRYRYLHHAGDVSVVDTNYIPHCVGQDAAGVIHSIYADLEATNDDYRDVHYLCLPMQRFGSQLYGGG